MILKIKSLFLFFLYGNLNIFIKLIKMISIFTEYIFQYENKYFLHFEKKIIVFHSNKIQAFQKEKKNSQKE